jgi:hypothetical protein
MTRLAEASKRHAGAEIEVVFALEAEDGGQGPEEVIAAAPDTGRQPGCREVEVAGTAARTRVFRGGSVCG